LQRIKFSLKISRGDVDTAHKGFHRAQEIAGKTPFIIRLITNATNCDLRIS